MNGIRLVDTKLTVQELSRSWPKILCGNIPGELDAFLILWQDPSTDRFLSWGIYLSTSEPPPHAGAIAFVALQTTIPIVERSLAGIKRAGAKAMLELEEAFFRSPTYVALASKLRDDLTFARDKPKSAIGVDIVSDKEFERATGRKVLQ